MHFLNFLLLAAALACALAPLAAQAQGASPSPPYDFSAKTFHGSNSGWSILLKRHARGEVVFVLEHELEADEITGALSASNPDETVGGMHASHALAGKASIHGRDRAMKVLIAPAKANRPCRDSKHGAFPYAIIVFVGDAGASDKERVLYGCGRFLAL